MKILVDEMPHYVGGCLFSNEISYSYGYGIKYLCNISKEECEDVTKCPFFKATEEKHDSN